MIYVLIILTMQSGEPIAEPMVFDTNAECHATASWVRGVDQGAKTVCFEVRNEE